MPSPYLEREAARLWPQSPSQPQEYHERVLAAVMDELWHLEMQSAEKPQMDFPWGALALCAAASMVIVGVIAWVVVVTG